jgi:very-short-patch-repair endonuclease
MLSDATRQKLSAAGRKGGLARAKAFDAAYQSAARAAVKPEHLAASGLKGHAVCQKRYGEHYAAQRLARWRRTRPTGLERTVASWLDAAFISFSTECELVVGRAYADIVVRTADGRRLDIECNSDYFHSADNHGTDHVAKDRARDDLVRAAGYTVLRLAQADIESGAAKETLSKEIGIAL